MCKISKNDIMSAPGELSGVKMYLGGVWNILENFPKEIQIFGTFWMPQVIIFGSYTLKMAKND